MRTLLPDTEVDEALNKENGVKYFLSLKTIS